MNIYINGLNFVSKIVKVIVRYAVEYRVRMFSCIFFGIFSLSAILTQNIEKFDWLRGAGIISKLASGSCLLL